MLLTVLLACSNAENPSFFPGGEAHAEGVAATQEDYNPLGIGIEPDTGGGGSDTTTATSADGPVLGTFTTAWTSTTTLSVDITYTDVDDDVLAGHLYWDLTSPDGGDLSGDYTVVDSADYVEGDNATAGGGSFGFAILGADATQGWTLGVTPVDSAGNYGARALADVEASG